MSVAFFLVGLLVFGSACSYKLGISHERAVWLARRKPGAS